MLLLCSGAFSMAKPTIGDNKMKTNKTLLEEKLIKLIRNRERALREKDWLKAADLEIRIEATEAKIDKI